MEKFKHYIGIDLHSAHCYIVVMNKNGKVTKRAKIKTNENDILKFLSSLKGKKAVTFEETTLAHWMYILLYSHCIVDKIIVCSKKTKTGPKTDYIDATELADLLRVNRLEPVFHEDNPRMELRALVSGYDSLIKDCTRTKNRDKALYRKSAIKVSGKKVYHDPSFNDLLISKADKFVEKQCFEQIALLEKQKEKYLKKFEQNMKKFSEMKYIKTVPGFSTIRTNILVGIVITPMRFKTKYNFYSYAGLTKHKQRSDGKEYGSKKAYGRSELKNIFKSAAQDALRGKNSFKRKYDEMRTNGSTDKAAQNAVAQALASTVLAVWKSETKYKDYYREVKQKENSQSRT